MIQKFERSGVSLQFPANWEMEDDADGDDWVLTLQTPGSGMLMATYRDDGPEPAEMADEAIEALREDYDQLDTEIKVEALAGTTALGYDIDFLTLVTAVTAKIRALETPEGTLLLFWQVAEKDRDTYESLLNAVFNSVAIAE